MGVVSTKTIYECDYCKKQGEWSPDWRHRTYFHTKGLWDETVITCSSECADKIKRKRSKGRS